MQCQIHKLKLYVMTADKINVVLTDWYVYCIYSIFNITPYQNVFIKMLYLIKWTLLANIFIQINYIIGFHSN